MRYVYYGPFFASMRFPKLTLFSIILVSIRYVIYIHVAIYVFNINLNGYANILYIVL